MSDFLDYARRGRNDWWRYLVCAPMALIFLVILITALTLSGGGIAFAAAVQNPSHPIAFFLAIGLMFALMTASFALAVWIAHRKSPAVLIGHWSTKLFGAGFALQAICVLLASLADFALHPIGFRWTASSQFLPFAAAATAGLMVQTFGEEFIFRGYVTQGLFLAIKRPWVASMVSGLLFGAFHYTNGGPECIGAVLFGVAAARIAIRTGGIAFTYGLHLINNLFLAVVVVSASDVFKGTPGLITETSTPSMMWWGVGVEALLLAAVTWIVLRWTAPEADRA